MSSQIVRSGVSGLRPYHRPSKAVSLRAASGAVLPDPEMTDLVGWYKPHAGGFVNDDLVATLVDYSGLALDLTASGADRPVYKSGQINGYGALLFDGTRILKKETTGVTSNGGCTVFVVSSLVANTPFGQLCCINNGATSNVHEIRFAGSSDRLQLAAIAGATPAGDAGVSAIGLGWELWSGLHKDSDGVTNLWQRLIANASQTNAGTSSLANYCMGARYASGVASLWINAYIAEILIYKNALNDTQRTTTSNYLIAKYGV